MRPRHAVWVAEKLGCIPLLDGTPFRDQSLLDV